MLFLTICPIFSTGNEKQSRSLKPTVETVGESEKGAREYKKMEEIKGSDYMIHSCNLEKKRHTFTTLVGLALTPTC